MILSKSSGEVREISGSSGTVAGFQVVSPLSPAALDPFADANPRLSILISRKRLMSTGIHAGESRG